MSKVRVLTVIEADFQWDDKELVVKASDYDQLKADNEVLTLRVMAGERQELDALKSAPVVMPNRMTDGAADYAYARYSAGWNACLDEFARLNGGKT